MHLAIRSLGHSLFIQIRHVRSSCQIRSFGRARPSPPFYMNNDQLALVPLYLMAMIGMAKHGTQPHLVQRRICIADLARVETYPPMKSAAALMEALHSDVTSYT